MKDFRKKENAFEKEILGINQKIRRSILENPQRYILVVPLFMLLICSAFYFAETSEKTKENKISALEEKCSVTAKEKSYKFYSLIQSSKNSNQRIESGNCAMSNTKSGQEFEIIQVTRPLEANELNITFKSVPN